MRFPIRQLWVVLAFLPLIDSVLLAEEKVNADFRPPLFAFQTGFARAASQDPAYLSDLVARSGFAGVELMGLQQVEPYLETLSQRNLKLYSLYLKIDLDSEQPYDAAIPELLKTHGQQLLYLWFHIHSQKFARSDPAGDEKCVKVLRELSDLVQPYEIGIGIYHHVGQWSERFTDGVRVARKVGRKNVGAVFNLCHYLKTAGPAQLEAELQDAFPHVMLVSINGADDGETTSMGWDRLIQPLDQGSFDVLRVLKVLQANHYFGPVGLQGFGISQKPEEFFPRSVKKYQELLDQLNPS